MTHDARDAMRVSPSGRGLGNCPRNPAGGLGRAEGRSGPSQVPEKEGKREKGRVLDGDGFAFCIEQDL